MNAPDLKRVDETDDLRRLVDELAAALRRIAWGELPAPHVYAAAILKETVGL